MTDWPYRPPALAPPSFPNAARTVVLRIQSGRKLAVCFPQAQTACVWVLCVWWVLRPGRSAARQPLPAALSGAPQRLRRQRRRAGQQRPHRVPRGRPLLAGLCRAPSHCGARLSWCGACRDVASARAGTAAAEGGRGRGEGARRARVAQRHDCRRQRWWRSGGLVRAAGLCSRSPRLSLGGNGPHRSQFIFCLTVSEISHLFPVTMQGAWRPFYFYFFGGFTAVRDRAMSHC